MTIVNGINICRDFKSGVETIHALKNVNIEIEEKKLTVFRGRSGSGKTTLINIIGGLDYPTSGNVMFQNLDITKLNDKERDEIRRREIGFVFQSVALISVMSAYENVEFGLRLSGCPLAEREKRAKECLALVGLSKRMNHRPQEMSGGEQQRVAIARAMAIRPKILIADEPTAELDSTMGMQVINLFKKLTESEGLTVVMTTHDPAIVETADTVYELNDGICTKERG